jgi:hypothetical protein
MVESPDLSTPFANDSERALYLAELLELSAELERWNGLAASYGILSAEQRREVLVGTAIPGDDAGKKLKRWSTLFDEEIQAVLDARNRAVHGVRLGDPELRGATWLAHHLLDLVLPHERA